MYATGLVAAGLLSFSAACVPGGATAATRSPKMAPSPTIHAVTPLKTAVVGTQLTIRGRNFLPGSRRNTVYLKAGRGAPVAVKADRATRTTIKVAIPRSVRRRMIVRAGVARPTRFRLRVRSRRLGKRYTAERLSPTIALPAASTSAEQPCPGAGCAAQRPIAALLGPTAAPPPPDAPPPSGRLVFEDNFDGTAVNTSNWGFYNSPGHGGNGLRRASAFSVANGLLTVTAAWDGTNIVSGGMAHRTNYTYGTFEVRVRTEADSTAQTSGVVLTWPQAENWPYGGENDFYETGTSRERNPFSSYLHHYRATSGSQQTKITHSADAQDWHVMRMDWSPDAIRIYRDDVFVGALTDPTKIPDIPHHLSIQLDAFSNNPMPGPVRMHVDWIRVYR